MNKSNSSILLSKSKNLLEKYFALQEKYIKNNAQLILFIKGAKRKISVSKNTNDFTIQIRNDSLIEIFNKINVKYLCIQDYLKLIIISEKRDTISLESKDSYDKYINILNHQTSYKIIKIKNATAGKSIKISKLSLKLIFKLSDIKFDEEIFNYLEIMINKEITAYHMEVFQNSDNLLSNIYTNNFGKNNFYIHNTTKNILNPISSYSIKKIIDMRNIIEDNNNKSKYFIFKIKDSMTGLFEEKNKKIIDNLSTKNEHKILYDKLHKNEELTKKWMINEEKNALSRAKKPDLLDFENYLLYGDELLTNISKNIEKYKNYFKEKIFDENNHFIQIKDINDTIRYVNNQYIELLHKKSMEYKNIYSKYVLELKIKDYLNQEILFCMNSEEINDYFSKPIDEKYIDICIPKENERFLVKKQFLEKLLEKWKILNKKYRMKTEYPKKEEKYIRLSEITIDKINEIKYIEGIITIKNAVHKIKYNKKHIKKEDNNNLNISNDDIKNNNEDNKNIDSLYLSMKQEKGENKSRNKKHTNLNFNSDNIKSSELLNNETTDSNDSLNMNRSMFLLNSLNSMPEKDFYSINKVIKVIKRNRKKKERKKYIINNI